MRSCSSCVKNIPETSQMLSWVMNPRHLIPHSSDLRWLLRGDRLAGSSEAKAMFLINTNMHFSRLCSDSPSSSLLSLLTITSGCSNEFSQKWWMTPVGLFLCDAGTTDLTLAQCNIKSALFYENEQFWSKPFVHSPNDLTADVQAVLWTSQTVNHLKGT